VIQEKTTIPGLSTRESEKRIKEFGLNELKHKKKISLILIFLSQFNDFMVWVLLGATLISAVMGDKADAITIIIIVIVNAILGFLQEFKTEKSLEALKSLAAPTCKVFRDGGLKILNSLYLTMGDMVILEAGDRMPAEFRNRHTRADPTVSFSQFCWTFKSKHYPNLKKPNKHHLA
jgi:Ca2+-transporting ATPase